MWKLFNYQNVVLKLSSLHTFLLSCVIYNSYFFYIFNEIIMQILFLLDHLLLRFLIVIEVILRTQL